MQGSGKVELDVLDISPELKAILRQADRDGDGRLSLAEIVGGLERAEEVRKGRWRRGGAARGWAG